MAKAALPIGTLYLRGCRGSRVSHIADKDVEWCRCFVRTIHPFIKLADKQLLHSLIIRHLNIYSRARKTYIYTKICIQLLIVVLFIIITDCKPLRSLWWGERQSNPVTHSRTNPHRAQNINTYNLNESPENYLDWSKSCSQSLHIVRFHSYCILKAKIKSVQTMYLPWRESQVDMKHKKMSF